MARYIPTSFAPRLYNDWYLLIKKLSVTKQAEVMRAIFEYPNFTPTDVDCWDFLSSRLEDQYQRFLSNKEKRVEAAKKGAAARWTEQKASTNSKSESNDKFRELLKADDANALYDALDSLNSGLSIFLSTGEGYEDNLTREEREFVDRGEVRTLCTWHKKIQKPEKKEKNKFRPPTLEEWLEYCKTDHPNLDEQTMHMAWKSYNDANWFDKYNSPVLNWKMKITQVWATKAGNNKDKKNTFADSKTGKMAQGMGMARKILKDRGEIQ